jgi:hypothetical protein
MSTPTLTPEEQEFIDKYKSDVARWAVDKVAKNVFGDTIASVISTHIFDLIGIGTTDSADEYHREVMEELHKIEGQIAAMQQAIVDVKNAITALGTLIAAEALASRLQELELQANVVRTHYELVSNDVAQLAGKDGAKAATDLFGRLQQPNDAAVALAMRNINTILLTTTEANPGVLLRLQYYVRDQLTLWATTPANYTNRPWADGTPDGCKVYMGTPVLTGTKLHNGGLDAARKVLPVIGELFKRVLAVQVQGLVYLGAAWRNGPQHPALVSQIQMLVGQIGLMQGFYAATSTLVNRTAVDYLRTYLPRVRSKLVLRPSYTSYDGSFPVPFDDAWILWDELIEKSPLGGESNSQFSTVRNAWDATVENPLTWRLYRNGSCPDWTWVTNCGAPYFKLPKFEDKPLPVEFDVLKSLPVKIPAPTILREHPEWGPYTRV